MDERRKTRRKKEANKLSLEPIPKDNSQASKKISIAFTDDISLCGFKIITDTYFPVDSFVKADVSLSKAQKTIDVTGKVRWIKDLADDTYEIGIEIVDTTRENIRIFYDHLYKYDGEN